MERTGINWIELEQDRSAETIDGENRKIAEVLRPKMERTGRNWRQSAKDGENRRAHGSCWEKETVDV